MMQTRTEKLYTSVLEAAGLLVDDSSSVFIDTSGDIRPILVDQKQLVVPSKEILKKPPAFWDAHVAFHPISENVHKGESEVFTRLKGVISLRLSKVIATLLLELAELGADKTKHAKLSPKQHAVLDCLKGADKTTISNVAKVIAAAGGAGNANHRLLRTYMKSGGKYRGTKHQKVCVNTFPLVDYVNEERRTIFNVPVRKADLVSIPALFCFILPGCDNGESYNYGTNTRNAPYFKALMGGFERIARQLNTIIDLFKDLLEEGQYLKTDLDWSPEMDKIAEMKHDIPPLDGNKGMGEGSESTGVVGTLPPADAVKQQAVVAATTAPVEDTPVVIKPGKDGYDWKELQRASFRQQQDHQQQQPMQQNVPVWMQQPTWTQQQPVQQPMQPVWQQQPMQQQPMQPQMQQQPAWAQPQQQQPLQPQMQQPQPAWAQPQQPMQQQQPAWAQQQPMQQQQQPAWTQPQQPMQQQPAWTQPQQPMQQQPMQQNVPVWMQQQQPQPAWTQQQPMMQPQQQQPQPAWAQQQPMHYNQPAVKYP